MAFFPASVPTSLELLDARNNRTVTLTAPIDDTVTTIPVADTSLIPTAGYVTATDGSAEAIQYTGVTASSLTGCTRGADGTTASSHGGGGTLGMWGNARYHNIIKEEVIAIAQNISDRIGLHATQVILQVNMNANGQKIFGMAEGTTAGDAVRYEQVLLLSGGTLTGPLYLPDGAVATPSLSFSADTNTGIYRIGADHFGFATNGTLRWQINSTGDFVILGSSASQILAGAGSAALPSYSFNVAGSSNAGIYTLGAGWLNFSTGGIQVGRFNNSAFELLDGSVSSPALSFISDPDTGIYRAASGDIRFTTDGSAAFFIRATNVRTGTGVQFQTDDGSVSAPTHTFFNDPNTGMYNSSADQLDFATGGVQRFAIAASGLISSLGKHEFTAGSAAAPAISFSGDPNTGVYNIGADSIGFSTNGVLRVTIDNSGLTVNSGTLAGTFTFADGTAALPSITFGSDLDTGAFRSGANEFSVATGGVSRLRIDGTAIAPIGAGILDFGTTANYAAHLYVGDGTVGTPAIVFANDPNTGIFRSGADQLDLVTGGVLRVRCEASNAGVSILGCTDGGSAAAGFVGQFVESVQSINVNSTGTNQWFDVTSISLTAGDWDVWWLAGCNSANYSVITDIEFGIGIVSGNNAPFSNTQMADWVSMSFAAGHLGKINQTFHRRANITSTTTFYGKAFITFASGTQSAIGKLWARRRR